jgi:hypothetical protein
LEVVSVRIQIDDIGVFPHHLEGGGLVHGLLVEFIVTEKDFLRTSVRGGRES